MNNSCYKVNPIQIVLRKLLWTSSILTFTRQTTFFILSMTQFMYVIFVIISCLYLERVSRNRIWWAISTILQLLGKFSSITSLKHLKNVLHIDWICAFKLLGWMVAFHPKLILVNRQENTESIRNTSIWDTLYFDIDTEIEIIFFSVESCAFLHLSHSSDS